MDLFAEQGPQALDMADAEVLYWPGVDLGESPTTLMTTLVTETPWREETLRLFGKTYLQPRLMAWYGDEGADYTYSGTRFRALPWTPCLQDLKARVEALCDAHFNSVLLNYYRDHRDSMGMHADDEPELGPQPVIASLSLGATRTLVFRHRRRRELESVKLPLVAGSLLLMRGDTQRCWKHGINKLTRPCGARVNLTFRAIHQD